MRTSAIPGVVISHRRTFPDARGTFLELMRRSEQQHEFVQVNHSFSRAGVLRGLHYHRLQYDLWYVVRGRARIALADLRSEAPRVDMFELDGDSASTLLIPPGVAHGYLAVADLDLIYLVTHIYDPSDEHGIAWDDPLLAIEWGVEHPVLSVRDQTNPPLEWPVSISSP
jgi:dTDP-4-dehydrorhamnose 3,5-epimerase